MDGGNRRFDERMFLLASVWNLAASLAGLVFTSFLFRLLFGRGIDGDLHLALLFRFSMLAVLLFGVGYWMVSRDLTLDRGIVWLGMAGKVVLFVVFAACFATGRATLAGPLLFTGDFVWALLFLSFLSKTKADVRVDGLIG